MSRLVLILSTILAGAGAAGLRAAEVPAAPKAPAVPAATAVPDAVSAPTAAGATTVAKQEPPADPGEAAVQDMLMGAFKNDPSGRLYFKSRKPQVLSVRQAVVQGLDRNLSVKRNEKLEDAARSAVQEARAVFDPVFALTVNYSRYDQYERKEAVPMYSKATENLEVPPGSGRIVPAKDLFGGKEGQDIPQPTRFLVYANPEAASFKRRVVEASKALPNPTESGTETLSISQVMPWGPQVLLTQNSVHKETFYEIPLRPVTDADGHTVHDANGNPVFKDKTTQYGDYNLPWTSNFKFGLYLPIPGAKNFGEYSLGDVGLKLAKLDSTRVYWDTRTVINETFREVDQAYWDLAGAAENLRATTRNKESIQTVAKQIGELLEKGRTTIYGKQQIETEIARVRSLEESAWNTYAGVSNGLVNLLDLPSDTVLLPTAYLKAMGEQFVPAEAGSDPYAVAMEKRPDYQAQKISLSRSRVLVRFAENQVRPDLTLQSSIAFQQTNSSFGFGDWEKSINAAIRHGDTRVHAETLTYTWPVMNRKAKSQLRDQRYAQDGQQILADATQRSIENDVGDAQAGLLNAKARKDLAEERYKSAKQAFESAAQMLAGGRITEFEIISKNQDYLNAEYERIAAQIACKKAESEMLWAEGILPNVFAEKTALDGFDKFRVNALAAGHALNFFAPAAVPAAASGK